jgi:ankyrin repeat protein
VECVEILIAHCCKINSQHHSVNPLCLASKFGHLKIVEMLLQKGAQIQPTAEGFFANLGMLIANPRHVPVASCLPKGA